MPPLLDLLRRENVLPTLAIFERRVGVKGGTPEQAAAFETMKAFVGLCHRAEVSIVVGSHTSAPFAAEGRAHQREMELWQECGMTPHEVLYAATLRTARFFQADGRLGSIEVGKLAGLVLVAGNPTTDLAAMKAVKRVMLNGHWVRD